MKLFVCDEGWRGAVVMVANNVEEVVQKLTAMGYTGQFGAYTSSDFEVYDIESNLIIETRGDA